MSMVIAAISIGIVFLYGCVGEIITEKAGHLNLGIPGIMCMGTAGGCYGVSVYMASLRSPSMASGFALILIAILFAMLFAAIAGAIYAFLTVTLRSNQNITGLALTTFGAGFADFFINTFVKKTYFSQASKLFRTLFNVGENASWIEQLLFSHGFLVYFGIIIAIAAALILRKTKVGLNLRAIGESPATADAAGINVNLYKYAAILIGSAIAGLGGLFYVMDFSIGSYENASTIQAFGWLAIALVIFTLWRPDLSILGSFVFGLLYVLSTFINDTSFAQKRLLQMLPYIITVVVLIITSIVGKKETQPPASLGLNYFREER